MLDWQKYLLFLLSLPVLGLLGAMMFSSELPAAWLPYAQVFATVLGFTVAATMVSWQVRANKIAELKLKLFETLNKRIEAVADACIAAGTYANFIPLDMEQYRAARERGDTLNANLRHPMGLHALHAKVGDAVGELTVAMESHEIVLQRAARVFLMAFNSSLHDTTNAFFRLLQNIAGTLPMPAPDGLRPAIFPEPPTAQQIARARTLADSYYDALWTIMSYTNDVSVACQNSLLGDLFPEPQRARLRTPNDPHPRHRAIDTSSEEAMAELERYFQNDTPWGRQNAQAVDRVRGEVAQAEAARQRETGGRA